MWAINRYLLSRCVNTNKQQQNEIHKPTEIVIGFSQTTGFAFNIFPPFATVQFQCASSAFPISHLFSECLFVISVSILNFVTIRVAKHCAAQNYLRTVFETGQRQHFLLRSCSSSVFPIHEAIAAVPRV